MWMTRDLVTIEPHTPITQAASLMAAHKIRRLPVVVTHAGVRQLTGIISATDVFRAYPLKVNPFAIVQSAPEMVITAEQIMNRHPVTTTPEAPIEEAARLMRDQKIGALPVMREQTLVGLISESDIFRAFVDCFDCASGGVRITFDASKEDDILELLSKEARLHGLRVHALLSTWQHERPVCVVQFAGKNVDALVADVWKLGHPVLNVLRLPLHEKARSPRRE
jgi:acetoin utilization protein AcuB